MDEFLFLLLKLMNEMSTLDESKAVSFWFEMLLKRMIEGGDYFLALPQGIFANDLANLVSVEYLWMLKPMAVVFVLLEFDTTLGDGCGV